MRPPSQLYVQYILYRDYLFYDVGENPQDHRVVISHHKDPYKVGPGSSYTWSEFTPING